MIPPPRARHAVAVAVLTAVSVLTGLLALRDQRFQHDQLSTTANAMRALHPELYHQDPVLGQAGLWRFYTPVWQWYLRKTLPLAGQDELLPLRVLAGPLAWVYLLGMYALLWQQCRSWTIACCTAVLSLVMIYVPGGSYWGMGPLLSVRAETVALALVPYLVLLFLQRCGTGGLLWIFLGAGLLGNVHAVTGMNLTAVLLLAHLGRGRFAPRAWAEASLGALTSLAAASPFLWHYARARMALGSPAPAALSWSALAQAFQTGQLPVLYPTMFYDALAFLSYTMALWVPALIVMLRAERFRVRNLQTWVWMLSGSLLVGLVLHGLSQLVGALRGSPPPVIDFVHALRFTVLPLYVLFAQGLVHLLRLRLPRLKLCVRVGLAAMFLLWVVPSHNLRVPRHALEDMLISSLPEGLWQERVQQRRRQRQRLEELRCLGQWLRSQTPPGTVLAAGLSTQDAALRLWSRRALVASREDLRYFYYMAPQRISGWLRLVEEQDRTLEPRHGGPTDLAAVVAFAREHGADYVLLKADVMPAVDELRLVVEPPSQAWGRHWQLLRASPVPAAGGQ